MGIPRLTSFIDRNFAGWKREKITGHLVIDGFGLCYYLYSFDWRHGGQYPQFHNCIVEFFESLRLSDIEPIVVYDGVDYRQEKVKTTMKRRKELVLTIHRHVRDSLSRQGDVGCEVLPMLAIEEFQYTLSNIHVKQVVVDGEADMVIAQVANYYACPVLSKDSDFYMYSLKGGFIPLDMFHWNCKPVVADVYYVQAFVDQFNLRHESVRLLIPAIAGNDFLPLIQSRRFINEGTTLESNKCHPLLLIVRYASQFEDFDDFKMKLSSMDQFLERDTLMHNCLECRKMYDCCVERSLDDVLSETELYAFDNSDIPRWVLNQFRSCNLRHSVMEAFVLHKCVLRVAVDDCRQPSVLLISRSLRQAIYCILNNIENVTEYIRHVLDIVGEKVNSATCTNADGNLPRLDQIPSLKVSEKSGILYRTLQCNAHEIEKLDSNWRLVTASVAYWVVHAEVPVNVVKALLLCFVYCSHCTHDSAFGEYQRITIPSEVIHSPKWLTVVHLVAQWQSTYLDTVSLNQILQLPLVNRSPAELFDGKILICFATLNHVMSSAEAKLSTPQQKLYRLLLDVVFSHSILPSAAKAKVPKKRVAKGKSASSTKTSSVFEHANKFSALRIDSSEDLSSAESD